MSRIYVPTKGPLEWRGLLANPQKHWKTGRSAKTVAHAWEAARGFPPEIQRAFAKASEPDLNQLELVLAIPEHQTPLPGGRRASQADVFALGRGAAGLAAVTIEAKVDEEFGPHVDSWLASGSAGKRKRWEFIDKALGLNGVSGRGLRYQLFHRFASAVVEANRFGARDAVMLVHAFGTPPQMFKEFACFAELFGWEVRRGYVQQVNVVDNVRLHVGWVTGNASFLAA